MHNKHDVTILDGGMGRELNRMGAPFRQPEWSALALMEAPEMVKQAHLNFIDAGAEVITTNAYALVPYHIGQERFEKDGETLIALSAKLARQAVEESGKDVKVAGCIPPLFGSYQPELFSENDAQNILKPLIAYQRDHVDTWLIETTSSMREATFVLKLLEERKKDIWISFSLTDFENDTPNPTLRSGEDLRTSLIKLKSDPIQPKGLLFNCSQPEEMLGALTVAGNIYHDIPLGVYANSFCRKKRDFPANEDIQELREELTPESYLEFIKLWIDGGAKIIGGCCGIGPEFIEALARYKHSSP